MARPVFSSVEPLESRIAPAALHPIADIVVGAGKTSTVLDLGNFYDTTDAPGYHPSVVFTTNFDADPAPGFQAGKVIIELREDVAPLTVQNFLNYVTSLNAKGDYNGVFFHRSVTTSNGSPLPILQAGGFDVSDPATHVVTGPTVHNEYSLPNVTGTISLAKTGAGPDTGTSEFFFNMGDNTQALGPHPGTADLSNGYTVFGKVTQGFDVLQKIFAQPTLNESTAARNGALTDVPYQGTYDSNPDHNGGTPAAALAASNYITIVSAKVLPMADAASPNVTFSVLSAVDHGTTTKTALVTPKLSGDNLTLTYNTAKSGVADITVRAINTATQQLLGDETFSVTLKPNMLITGVGDSFQPVLGPGDVALGQVALANSGGATLAGDVTVNFYLSAVTSTDTDGTKLDSSDILLKTFAQKIAIGSGKSAVVTAGLTIPTDLAKSDSNYHIISSVTAIDSTQLNELYTDDQVPVAGAATHTLRNLFGNVTSRDLFGPSAANQLIRAHPSLTYEDAGGHLVTATITGPGYGQLTPTYTGNVLTDLDLDFFNTSAATTVTFKVADGVHTTLDTLRINLNIAADGSPIGTLNLGSVDLTGSFFATGGVKSVTLGDIESLPANVGSPHFFSLGASAALAKVQPAVKLGHLEDTVLSSSLIVGSLSVASWANEAINDTSTLPGVKSLLVSGDMHANLDINAKYGDPAYVNPAVTLTTSSFKVTGTLLQSSVKIAGSISAVDLGAIDTSQFLVGADFVPSNVAQFDSVRTVASFIVRGIAGKAFSMSDSDIVAANFTSIKVSGALDTSSGSASWGFVADKIGAYARTASGTGGNALPAASLKNLALGSYDVHGRYELSLL